jgi:hypothetical protein
MQKNNGLYYLSETVFYKTQNGYLYLIDINSGTCLKCSYHTGYFALMFDGESNVETVKKDFCQTFKIKIDMYNEELNFILEKLLENKLILKLSGKKNIIKHKNLPKEVIRDAKFELSEPVLTKLEQAIAYAPGAGSSSSGCAGTLS